LYTYKQLPLHYIMISFPTVRKSYIIKSTMTSPDPKKILVLGSGIVAPPCLECLSRSAEGIC
jgi:hypothetical protein